MAVELEGLEFRVVGVGADESAQSLESMAKSLTALKSAIPTKAKLSGFVANLTAIKNATSGIEANTKALSELGSALRSLSSAKVSPNIAKNLNEISFAGHIITDESITRIQSLADALSGLQGIGNIKINVPQASVTGGAEGQDNPFEAWTDVEPEERGSRLAVFLETIKTGFQGVAGAAITAGSAVVEFLAKADQMSHGALSGFLKLPGFFAKDMVGGIKKATGAVGGLFAGLQRIAMYRLLRTAIKLFTEGLTTGLKNLYGYSELVGTSFHKNMDLIATNALYVKNSLGAMVAPLINAIAPAVDFVTQKFVDLFNVVNMFIARLTGAETTTIAKKTFDSWGDDADKSAGKVKDAVDKIKRTILGFDELNVLNGPNEDSGGSGSGSGSGGADVGSMFEQVPIESSISDFADRIKEAFERGAWSEVGTIIGAKVNDVVDMIPWGDIGTKIGTGITAAIQIAYAALSEIDFVNIGSKFATLFNNALTALDMETLGKLMVKKFTVLGDLIIGAITTVNWGQVASKASDFVIGVFSEISKWLQSVKWGDFTTSLYESLKSAIANVKFGDIASAIFGAIGSAIGAAASIVLTLGKDIVGDIADAIGKAIDGITSLGSNGESIIEGVFNGMKNFIVGIGTWLKTNIFDPLVDGFKKTFQIGSPSKAPAILDIGKNIMLGLLNGILSGLGDIASWLKTNIVDKITDAWGKFWKDPVGFTLDFTANLVNWVKSSKFVSTISDMAASFASWVKGSRFGSSITGMVSSFSSWAKGSGFGSTISSMTSSFTSWVKGSGFGSTIGSMTSSFANWVKGSGFGSTIGSMTSQFTSWAKGHGFGNTVSSMIAQFTSWAKGGGARGFSNTVTNMVAQFSSWVKKSGKGGFSSTISNMVAQISRWTKKGKWKWPWENVTVSIKKTTGKKTISDYNNSNDRRARGGAYYSGHWHNIAQYATGGIPSQGTMFVAGEAGAEVVGDINGRTEVLNQSQLASAIHSAVLSAMQQANASGQSPVFNITVRTENNEVLARAVTRGQKSLDARLNPTAQYA